MSKQLSVLFLGRGDFFGAPREDTEFLLALKPELNKLGWHVGFSPVQRPLQGYDIIHLLGCNDEQAVSAVLGNKPYVLSPFYRGRGEQSARKNVTTKILLDHYLFNETLERSLPASLLSGQTQRAAPNFTFALHCAETIIVSSTLESNLLERDFQGLAPRTLLRPPAPGAIPVDREKLRQLKNEWGIGRYLLTFGRMGPTQNQLMLLHALKDEELPLIVVEQSVEEKLYAKACREVKRKGPTIFTGPLSDQELAGFILEASVCVLPSWNDSSGIEIKQVQQMCPRVVLSDWSMLREAFGTGVFLCEPDKSETIMAATRQALATLPAIKPAGLAAPENWQESALQLATLYQTTLNQFQNDAQKVRKQREDLARGHYHLQQFKSSAVNMILNGVQSPADVVKEIDAIIAQVPNDLELRYLKGLANVMCGQSERALEDFMQIVRSKAECPVVIYILIAICLLKHAKTSEVAQILEQARLMHPFLGASAMQLINSYLQRKAAPQGETATILELKQIVSSGLDLRSGANMPAYLT